MQEFRLYQFLTAISDRYETEKKELLKKTPLPSVEAAFSEIKRAEARTGLIKHGPSEVISSQGIGQGLAIRTPQVRGRGKDHTTGQQQQRSASKTDKSHLLCDHCGKKGHKKETCFQILGYPDWWEGKKVPTGGTGKMAAVRGIEGGAGEASHNHRG